MWAYRLIKFKCKTIRRDRFSASQRRSCVVFGIRDDRVSGDVFSPITEKHRFHVVLTGFFRICNIRDGYECDIVRSQRELAGQFALYDDAIKVNASMHVAAFAFSESARERYTCRIRYGKCLRKLERDSPDIREDRVVPVCERESSRSRSGRRSAV